MSSDDDRTGPSTREQEILARLRAADPAADREPADGLAEQIVASTAVRTEVRTDELAARRSVRARRWPSVLAGAAAAAIIGVGGYAAGATGVFQGAGMDAAESTDMLESAEELGEETAADSAQDGAASDESAADESAAQSAAADALVGSELSIPESADAAIYPAGPGRTTFTASGLGTQTGQAAAYALDPNAEPAQDVASRAADVFGVAGEPDQRDGAWWVEGRTALAPTLSVTLDGALTLNYSSAALSPWNCGNDELHTRELAAAGVDCEDLRAPAQAEAVAMMESLLAELGVEADLETQAQELPEVGITSVTGTILIEGVASPLAYYLELSAAGVASFSGPMAPVVDLGEYPVVSEQEAADRLSDPAYGALSYPVMPAASSALGLQGETGLQEDASSSGLAASQQPPAESTDTSLAPGLQREPFASELTLPQDWTPPTQPPATPIPGAQVPWEVQEVALVSAELTLTTIWTQGGAILLVPAYELGSEEGGTWSTLALAPQALDLAG